MRLILTLSLVLVPCLAAADEGPVTPSSSRWSGAGELGLAVSRGNAESENLNAKLALGYEDSEWKHAFYARGLRAKGEVTGDFDGDGVVEERTETTANRYELGASSALKVDERNSWFTALRYENDDFAAYAWQSTLSVGYGRRFIENERTQFGIELGPGYRRARDAVNRDTESDFIGRSLVDFGHQLTDNTQLSNVLLVEAGSDNTFAQNDLGLKVAMNASLALKAGVQWRHNTEVEPGTEKTDTLSTVNLVYSFE